MPDTPTQEELDAAEKAREEAIEEAPTEATSTDIEKFSPDAKDLEIPRGLGGDDLRHAVVTVFDRADEEAILAELGGRTLPEYFYEYSSGGTDFFDLSYFGVREAARTANREGAEIACPNAPIVDESATDDKGNQLYRVMIQATDAHGGSQWGVSEMPKMMSKRNGEQMWDKFALPKAVNKAQRNAMRALLPGPVVEAMKAAYKGNDNRVRTLARGLAADDQVSELPPPATSEKAEALRAEIEATYSELRGINRTALTPALYRSHLTRSEHDERELERFLGWLKTTIEDERAKLADNA